MSLIILLGIFAIPLLPYFISVYITAYVAFYLSKNRAALYPWLYVVGSLIYIPLYVSSFFCSVFAVGYGFDLFRRLIQVSAGSEGAFIGPLSLIYLATPAVAIVGLVHTIFLLKKKANVMSSKRVAPMGMQVVLILFVVVVYVFILHLFKLIHF